MEYLSASQRDRATMLILVAHTFSVMAICNGQVSVAVLILRMLVKVQRWQKFVLSCVIVSVSGLGVTMCIVGFVQCSPPRVLWTSSMDKEAHCWNLNVMEAFTICASSEFLLDTNGQTPADS